ncbi:MAG: MarR family winged helix-turn-helix transcriptional regulator [Candidatus Gracilibacteria bacterium]|nr:MarR family winged helix-turn-helix transcriptional regulator [Candidatus Gracilibacteria bacterium]
MSKLNIDFILSISKLNMVLSKDFDGKLGGLGLNDFIVLYHLNSAEGNKLRRIDLADKVGLTASGITRLLLPMEKIGLVSKETNVSDARVSFVLLAPGGKNLLVDAIKRMEEITDIIIPENSDEKVKTFIDFMKEIGGKVMWK